MLNSMTSDNTHKIEKSSSSLDIKTNHEINNIIEKLNYYIDTKNKLKYAQSLESISVSLVLKGDFSLYKNLLEKLDEEIISQNPILCICLGWSKCLTHELHDVDKYIEYAENINKRLKNKDLYNYIEILKAYYYTLYSKADLKYFMKCIELLLDIKNQVNENHIIFSTIERVLGGLYIITNEWEKALSLFKKAINNGKETKNYLAWSTSICNYSFLEIFNGNLNIAKSCCNEALKEVSEIFNNDNTNSFSISAYIYYPLSKALYLEGKSQQAISILLKNIELSEKSEGKFIQILSMLELALILAYEGDINRSLEFLSVIENNFDNIPISNDIFIEYNLLKLWIIHKKTEKLNIFEKEFLSMSEKEKTYTPYKSLLYAQILIDKNCFSEAQKELDFVLLNNPVILIKIECLILYAIVSKKVFNYSKAKDLLEIALSIGYTKNLIKPFINYFPFIDNIIFEKYEEKKLTNEKKEFIKKIIDNSKNKIKEQTFLDDKLTEREFEILMYLSKGLSNKDIADKTYVALGTIKKHTNSIYTKLNVINRVSAIQKAKEMGLI